jgi:hypothetical protein
LLSMAVDNAASNSSILDSWDSGGGSPCGQTASTRLYRLNVAVLSVY